MTTNQIGVARTILANLPITPHSQDRGRPLLGYVPLAPHRAYRVRRDPEPETPHGDMWMPLWICLQEKAHVAGEI